jgi:KaiC/GvpD/RAD55 family RecA-like ATPase
MADLMIGKTNVSALLRKKYASLGKGWITLVEVPASEHMGVNTESLKILINEFKYDCVYITLSKPFNELDKLFKAKGVNIDRLFYVDAISNMYGASPISTKRCAYASGPLDIDSITVSLREMLARLTSDKKSVFLDSITTVLLYNSLPRTIRFSQFLTQTLKNIGVDGIMMSITKGKATEPLVKHLATLCDEAISIEGGGRKGH